MSFQIITPEWAELQDVSETGLNKYIENRTNESKILIYFGNTAPENDLEAATLSFPESGNITSDLSTNKVWVKSIDNNNATITIQ